MRVRAARRDDLPAIEQLVAEMFRDLGTADQPALWNAELAQAFTERLGRDIAAYVTVDQADRPVAVAIGVVDQRLPSPRRLTGEIGYVEWLATEAQYRRRGAARLGVQTGPRLSAATQETITDRPHELRHTHLAGKLSGGAPTVRALDVD
jgi:hypothetical protein